MRTAYPRATVDRAIALLGSGTSVVAVGRELGIPHRTISNWKARLENGVPVKSEPTEPTTDTKEGFTVSGDNGSQLLTLRSHTIRTLEGAIEEANVDLDVWEVERYVVEKWDVGAKLTSGDGHTKQEQMTTTELWLVKVWLKRKTAPAPQQSAIENLITTISEHAPKYPKIIRKPTGKHLLEVSCADLHIGKLCWSRETGTDYDVEIAEKVYLNAVEELIGFVHGFGIERILIPLGNDFFTVNSDNNTTFKGTPQDVDGRLAKVFEIGYKATIRAIDYCLGIAPVDVLWVPGNHDKESSLYMAHVLKAWYNNSKDVTVDVEPSPRKYYRWGTNLLGFTHGDEEPHRDLPTIMAVERPVDWAETTTRAIHLGHFHKRKETRYSAGDTFGGVSVEVLPSLSGTDSWHHTKGYVKTNRAAVAYLWGFETGRVGSFVSNVKV